MAPTKPSMLALPAMILYATEKHARSRSAPGSKKESASSVCVQSVREGSTMARNLEDHVSTHCMLADLITFAIIPCLLLFNRQRHPSGPVRLNQVFDVSMQIRMCLSNTPGGNAVRCGAVRSYKKQIKSSMSDGFQEGIKQRRQRENRKARAGTLSCVRIEW
jgi:hypothetical protein